MPRGLILGFVFSLSACAAIWPPSLGNYRLKSAAPASPPANQPLAAEYGFDSAERADFGEFQVTALRFKDVTGAYAASLDPANKGDIRVGNYLLSCQGKCPKNLAALADASLPHVSHGALPSLADYFPAKNQVSGSERYILGPIGLAVDAPEIPASAVNFDFGTEGQLGKYRTKAGQVTLAVFSFPTPSFARQQLPEFQKIAGASVQRSGPLVAVAFGPATEAGKFANGVSYEGVVSQNEKPPDKPLELKPESAGKMILSILSLAGIVLGFCLLSGLAVGGSLRLARRFGYSAAEGSLITLHLEGK